MALLQIGDFDLAKQDLDFIDTIKTSLNDTETSRLGKEFDSRIGRLKKNGYVPAVAGAVWTSGVTFNNYKQFLIESGIVYALDPTVTPPVVTGATPDANFIQLISLFSDDIDYIFDKYNKDGLRKYTDILFDNVTDLGNLQLTNGETAVVEIGDAVRVKEFLDNTISYIVIDSGAIVPGDTTIPLVNGLFAKELVYSRNPAFGNPFKDLNLDNDAQRSKQPVINFDITSDTNIAASTEFSTIGQDGNIYWLDSAGDFMVKHNEQSNSYSKLALDNTSYSFWNGAVLGSDGCIYSCPISAGDNQKVSKLNTQTGVATLIDVTGLALTGATLNKANGVLNDNGVIYFSGVDGGGEFAFIKVDTLAGTSEYVVTAVTGGDFGTGCIAPNGKIYYAPITGSQFLELDPDTDTATLFGTVTVTPHSYRKCVVGYDGFVYAIPFRQTDVVKIDPFNTGTIDYNFITVPNSTVGYPDLSCCSVGTDQKVFANQGGNDPALIVIDLENVSLKSYNDYDVIGISDFRSMCVNGNGSMISAGPSNLVSINNIDQLQAWPKSAYAARS